VDFPETDEISGWISIEEKLPENRGPVLGVMKDTLEALSGYLRRVTYR
jgi:hypothetical protein